MADFELQGTEEIKAKLKKLNAQSNRIENKALREGGKVILDEIKRRAPRSDVPRPPGGKTQRWRTGKHAADLLKVGNVRREKGGKIVRVGLLKGDTSKIFYLKFHEWGTSKMPARPFMEPAQQEKEQEALQAIRDALKEGLGL